MRSYMFWKYFAIDFLLESVFVCQGEVDEDVYISKEERCYKLKKGYRKL